MVSVPPKRERRSDRVAVWDSDNGLAVVICPVARECGGEGNRKLNGSEESLQGATAGSREPARVRAARKRVVTAGWGKVDAKRRLQPGLLADGNRSGDARGRQKRLGRSKGNVRQFRGPCSGRACRLENVLSFPQVGLRGFAWGGSYVISDVLGKGWSLRVLVACIVGAPSSGGVFAVQVVGIRASAFIPLPQ
jgi:hypothetical protein